MDVSGNPLVQLFDADLNSECNRAILRFLCGRAGHAIARIFPTRAAACYSGLVAGFGLAFIPIAKGRPKKSVGKPGNSLISRSSRLSSQLWIPPLEGLTPVAVEHLRSDL